MGNPMATPRPLSPECWISSEGPREVRCLGPVEAERGAANGIWLWFTGTDRAFDLTAGEQAVLAAATRVDALTRSASARLARRIGRRRARRQADQWGVWSIPVDQLEPVLCAALTRQARAGAQRSFVA